MTQSPRFGMMISSDEPGDRDPARILDDYVERALAVRDVGFDMVVVGQRYSYGPARPVRGEPLYTWRLQPLLVLAHVASLLRDSVSYATSVLLSPGAHPVQLAEDVATLDTMCYGRLHLGIGLGWMPYEFDAFGIDHADRGQRFEELLTVYRALMTSEEVSHAGPRFLVDGARIVARGRQRPMPPLWVGASADAAVRRAARHGDAWVMSSHLDIETLERQQAIFDAERARVGLPSPTRRPIMRMLAIADDRRTALEEVRPAVEDWYRKRGEWGWFLTGSPDTDIRAISSRWIVGDPDDCADQIKSVHERLGATDIIFVMAYPGATQQMRLRMIELMGRHVLPRFARTSSRR